MAGTRRRLIRAAPRMPQRSLRLVMAHSLSRTPPHPLLEGKGFAAFHPSLPGPGRERGCCIPPAIQWRAGSKIRKTGSNSMSLFTRDECLQRLRAQVAAGKPIIGGGAGTGLSAKCAEAGGIDLIIIYNSGRFRMAGR